jgi:hypothetical protein
LFTLQALQKWWVQSAISRMIGIGMPISHRRMERMTTFSFSTARRTNGLVAATVPWRDVGPQRNGQVSSHAQSREPEIVPEAAQAPKTGVKYSPHS